MEKLVYTFGPYRLSPSERRLWRAVDEVDIEPRQFDLLLFFVEHPSELITVETLRERVWDNDHLGEKSIPTTISKLRKLLENGSTGMTYIEAARTRGYYFVCSVESSSQSSAAPHRAQVPVNQLPNLRTTNFYELWNRGLSTAAILEALIAIDYENLAGLDEASEGTRDQWVRIAENSPDNWVFLIHDGERDDKYNIAGYWHLEAIGEEVERELLSGEFEDSDLSVDKIHLLCSPGEYNVYFVMFVVRLLFRGFRANRLLYDALASRIAELNQAGIMIRKIYAHPFTPEGVALCRTFGLRQLRDHNRIGAIFEGEASIGSKSKETLTKGLNLVRR